MVALGVQLHSFDQGLQLRINEMDARCEIIPHIENALRLVVAQPKRLFAHRDRRHLRRIGDVYRRHLAAAGTTDVHPAVGHQGCGGVLAGGYALQDLTRCGIRNRKRVVRVFRHAQQARRKRRRGRCRSAFRSWGHLVLAALAGIQAFAFIRSRGRLPRVRTSASRQNPQQHRSCS